MGVVNFGVLKRLNQCVDTQLKRIKDFTGSLFRMSSIISWDNVMGILVLVEEKGINENTVLLLPINLLLEVER